jgi:hypothetical protein
MRLFQVRGLGAQYTRKAGVAGGLDGFGRSYKTISHCPTLAAPCRYYIAYIGQSLSSMQAWTGGRPDVGEIAHWARTHFSD